MSRQNNWLILVLLALGAAGVALFALESSSAPLPPRAEAPSAPAASEPPEALAGTRGPADPVPPEGPARQVVPEEAPAEAPVPEGELLGRVVDTQARGREGVKVLLLEAAPRTAGRGQRGAPASPAELYRRLTDDYRRQVQMRAEMEAKLRAGGLGDEQIRAHMERVREQSGLKQLAAAASDAEGRFRLPRPAAPAEGKALLVQALASNDYLPPEMIQVAREHLESGRLPDIVLIRPAAVRGLVTGLQGERSRAEVVAWRLGERESLERRSRWVPPGGVFALEDLTPGTWRLALHQRWGESAFQWGPVLQLREAETIEGVNIAVAPECVLELLLLGPGRSPLEAQTQVGLSLCRLGPKGEPGESIAVQQELNTQAPQPGEPCRFERLSPGLYRVEALLAGLAAPAREGGREEAAREKEDYKVSQEVELTGGLQRLELVFPKIPRLGSLEVLVTDSEGGPLGGARVALFGQQVGPSVFFPGMNRSAETNSRGIASFQGLIPAKFRIHVWARDYLGGSESIDMAREGEGAHLRRELALARAAACKGRVVDADGKGVQGVLVRLTRQGSPAGVGSPFSGMASSVAVTDAEGRFQLNNLQEGAFELLASIRGGSSARQAVRLFPGKTEEIVIRL